MAYFKVCPGCGASLDPGEECEDCREKAKRALAAKTAGSESPRPSVPLVPKRRRPMAAWQIALSH